jgi:hypothetical protein
MTEFEVAMPLAGGILIGIAAAMTLLFSGKIAGISGIFGGILFQQGTERTWQTVFVAGLNILKTHPDEVLWQCQLPDCWLVSAHVLEGDVPAGTECVASAGFRHVHLRLRLRLWWQEWPWWPFFKIFITEN